jgi:hypothetical protein
LFIDIPMAVRLLPRAKKQPRAIFDANSQWKLEYRALRIRAVSPVVARKTAMLVNEPLSTRAKSLIRPSSKEGNSAGGRAATGMRQIKKPPLPAASYNSNDR